MVYIYNTAKNKCTFITVCVYYIYITITTNPK